MTAIDIRIQPAPRPDAANELHIARQQDEDDATALARVVLAPEYHSARVVGNFGKSQFADNFSFMAVLKNFQVKAAKLATNDLSDVEATLMAQATSLDVLYSELAHRAAIQPGENFEAMERYIKLALKAQNQCRMTLETLANVKNPPVVYAK